jgi:hypothetical protein
METSIMMTLRSFSAVIILGAISAFSMGCSVATGGEETDSLDSALAKGGSVVNVIPPDEPPPSPCPEGEHVEYVCPAMPGGAQNVIPQCDPVCVPDEPPPPPEPSACPEGQHEEIVCSAAPANVQSLIAPPPTCETICVDDEPEPPSACPEGTVETLICPIMAPKSNASSLIAPPGDCWTECVVEG